MIPDNWNADLEDLKQMNKQEVPLSEQNKINENNIVREDQQIIKFAEEEMLL